ncbi:TAXI family TRAP transporter solute-binding subunit [Microaerobacter geothermalis]|uniref:TAXI family TRAP transporter solute-binding subunit n=1 Tax=Microaerobacter geothermalis TaxID=674972 RepID=UPI0022A70EBD|nr:TAXI family TRAP transporter solute-binding subunit [Microaerobacter geothermalis]MCF6093214.1 TAXI family TRAP transporter solute-binding subunit [Microaerobacter geothermalis]
MKRKGLLFFILSLAFILVLAGCGASKQDSQQGGEQPKEQAQEPAKETPSQIVIATGGTAGTYYPLGGGMAQIFTDKAGVNATAQSTGASVENMRLIRDEQVDLAFTQSDIADYATKGTVMFEGDQINNIRAIAALYPETIQIVVPAKSDINSVADLKGKRVSVGAPGSGTEANAQQILEIYGMTFEDIKAERLSFKESSSNIQDGVLDAAFVTAGAPTSAITELSATTGVKIIQLEDDKIADLIAKYPYYAEQVIPAGTYSGQDADVKTVAVKAMLVARDALSDDAVYNMTKALFENLEQLATVNAKAKVIKLEDALKGVSLDVHPGAAKYYEEKGVK